MRGTSQQYAEKHSPGQLALLKQIRNYRMDVDSAHRDCIWNYLMRYRSVGVQ